MEDAYRIIGIESSPYAMKVRAAFRYRRLPHIWVARMPQLFEETAGVRPLIMPTVQFPEGDYRTDSTPILLDLEERHRNGRSLLPDAPEIAFLALLIEDMADEWLAKYLFHNRFSHEEDARFASSWVIDDAQPAVATDALDALAGAFRARQTERMAIVGCTPENGPFFERFYLDLLAIMESFVATDRFLFGSRPSIADFGIYGQFCPLSADPTSAGIMRDQAPRTMHWTWRTADASGVEGEWFDWPDSGDPPPHIRRLLGLAGQIYLPFLAANAAAVDAGAEEVKVDIQGEPYRQLPFRYQAKCLRALQARFADLPNAAKAQIAPLLDESGCLAFLV